MSCSSSSCSKSPCTCENATNVNLNTADRVNVCCRRGDTFVLEVNVKDSAGAALDATLYSYKVEVREYDDGPIIIASTAVATTSTSAGKVTITITAANMLVTAGTYVYGLQATKTSDSTVETWIFGTFEVVQDIVQ